MSKALLVFLLMMGTGVQLVWAQRPLTSDPSNFGNNNGFGNGNEFDGFGNQNDTSSAQRGENGQLLLEPNPEELYGATTTTYIFESDWLDNRKGLRFIDTTLTNFHRYNYVAQEKYTFQDLGNLGTAAQSMYYTVPDRIGVRTGLNALSLYTPENKDIRYYDTKSPYSRWYYVQGSAGRSVVDVIFSQNIKPNWNATIEHKRINSRLLVGTEPANSNDRQVSHETWIGSSRFTSKNGKYKLLLNFNHYRHFMAETGGLLLSSADSSLLDSYVPADPDEIPPSDFETIDELFTQRTGELNNVFTSIAGAVPESERRRSQFHTFQQFTLAGREALQLYHTFNASSESYSYFDPTFSVHDTLYQNVLLYEGPTMRHDIRFNELENQAGIKGTADKLFYTIYVGRRDYRYQFSFFDGENVPRDLKAQNYYGFKGLYQLTPKISFKGNYEQIVAEQGGSSVYAEMNMPYFTASHKRLTVQPDLMQEYYFGNIFSWNHLPGSAQPFDNLDFAVTEAKASLPIGKLSLKPFAKYATFRNYTYYNNEAVPEQFTDGINVLQLGTQIHYQLGVLHQDFYGMYARSSQESVLRLPQLLFNYNVYVEVNFPGKTMLSRFGLDLHWHSDFFADAYSPVTQQFFLQDDLRLGNYLQSELYWTFNMKKVNMFLKLTNATQGLLSGEGYYLTPLYMAQPRAFEFGVSWVFFD